jgi:hypothetical protein
MVTHNPPLRPNPLVDMPNELTALMSEAWATNPDQRPTASEVHRRITELIPTFPGGDTPIE